MKLVKFIAYLFYRYYSTGPTKDIPYFSTLCALVMLAGLHIFQIIVLFGYQNSIPTNVNNTRVENFIIVAVCLIPIFILMAFLIRKSDLQAMSYDENKIKKGNILLILYIVSSVALLLLLVLIKKGKL